jgi:hypothetical protein
VHEDVAAKDEGVAVDLGYDGPGGGTNVSEDAMGFSVGAEGFEVEVVNGWRLRFVKCWTGTGYALNVGGCGLSVP